MLSPWQWYKYCVDVHFYRNLADVAVCAGVIGLVLGVALGVRRVKKIGNKNKVKVIAKWILKYKVKIIEIFGWIFMPIIGFYGLINVFYDVND